MRKFLLPLLVIAIATSALLGSTASASATTPVCLGCGGLPRAPIYMSSNPSYIGWGSIDDANCVNKAVADYCTWTQHTIYCFRAPCTQPAPVASITAYRWANSKWTAVQVQAGSAYLYPYGSGWAWAWRRDTGWLALRGEFARVPWSGAGTVVGDCNTGC
jgi:hypothetical protein